MCGPSLASGRGASAAVCDRGWSFTVRAEKLYGRICGICLPQMGIKLPLGILATPPVGGLTGPTVDACSSSLVGPPGLWATWVACDRSQQSCTEKVLPGSMRAVSSQRAGCEGRWKSPRLAPQGWGPILCWCRRAILADCNPALPYCPNVACGWCLMCTQSVALIGCGWGD